MIAGWLRRTGAALQSRVRPERIVVVLDVVEQIILLHLYRTGEALEVDIRAVVDAAGRVLLPGQVRVALLRMESMGLIVRTSGDAEGSAPRFQATARGRRLRKAIRVPAQSAIITRV